MEFSRSKTAFDALWKFSSSADPQNSFSPHQHLCPGSLQSVKMDSASPLQIMGLKTSFLIAIIQDKQYKIK